MNGSQLGMKVLPTTPTPQTNINDMQINLTPFNENSMSKIRGDSMTSDVSWNFRSSS